MNTNSDETNRLSDDGIEMKWDQERNAYFPNIDEEFIYRRYLDYGFIDETKVENENPEPDPTPMEIKPEWLKNLENDFLEQIKSENNEPMTEEEYNKKWNLFYQKKAEKYQKNKNKPIKNAAKRKNDGWIELDDSQNKYIYVENLPLDVTQEEFMGLVKPYGMVMYEPFTNTPKAKLYRDKDGNPKGDGICCYLKIESIVSALECLDGYNLRGNIIRASRGKFEKKDNYVPQKKRKMTDKEKKKLKKQHEKLLSWAPEMKNIRHKKDNTVILKNVFDHLSMKENPELAFDIKERISKDVANIGQFKSIKVHELHPESVVQINFHDANQSDIAIQYFNNKLWNGRKITAEIWDGKTKYKVKESEEEEQERLEKWEKRLEGTTTEDKSPDGVNQEIPIEEEIEQESLDNLVKALAGDDENESCSKDNIESCIDSNKP